MPTEKQSSWATWWESTGAAMTPYNGETPAAFNKRVSATTWGAATYRTCLTRATRGLNNDSKKYSTCRLCGCATPPGLEVCDNCAATVMRRAGRVPENGY